MRLYTHALEGDLGRIDHVHVSNVILDLITRGERQGSSGTRIFVDASWLYFSQSRSTEWFAFEEWLGRRLSARVALVCACRSTDVMDPAVLANVLRTHAYRFEAATHGVP